jgi:hypothetical protein
MGLLMLGWNDVSDISYLIKLNKVRILLVHEDSALIGNNLVSGAWLFQASFFLSFQR